MNPLDVSKQGKILLNSSIVFVGFFKSLLITITLQNYYTNIPG